MALAIEVHFGLAVTVEVSIVKQLGEWRARPGSLARRLSAALQALIERGTIAPAAKLPSERALADRLAVSRGTVVAAYAALLELGVVVRVHGSGTYVRVQAGEVPTAAEHVSGRTVEQWLPSRAGVIELSHSVLPDASRLPLSSVPWLEDGAAMFHSAPAHGYGIDGDPGLREAITAHMSRWGLDALADEILVTNGAQEAIALAVTCLLEPGQSVLVESPSYPGAIAALTRRGARIRSVPVDRHGPLVEPFRVVIERHRPAFAYLMPCGHNPTGTVTAANRRAEIVRLCAANDVPIVEDLALADLVLDDHVPVAPLAARSDADARADAAAGAILTIGSASKVLWGGLRIGWLRAPEPYLTRLRRAKVSHDIATSPITQRLAARLLAACDDQYLVELRRELRVRRDRFSAAVREALPEWTFSAPAAGMSLWIRLPAAEGRPADGAAFAAAALRQGVAVASGSASATDGRHDDHIRISFAVDEPTMSLAVERLARAADRQTRT